MDMTKLKSSFKAIYDIREGLFKETDAAKEDGETVIYGDLTAALGGLGLAIDSLDNIIENNQDDDGEYEEDENGNPIYQFRYCFENSNGTVEWTKEDNPAAFISLYRLKRYHEWEWLKDFDNLAAYVAYLNELEKEDPELWDILMELEILEYN